MSSLCALEMINQECLLVCCVLAFFRVRKEIRICILGRADISDLTDSQQKQLRMRMLTCSQHHSQRLKGCGFGVWSCFQIGEEKGVLHMAIVSLIGYHT